MIALCEFRVRRKRIPECNRIRENIKTACAPSFVCVVPLVTTQMVALFRLCRRGLVGRNGCFRAATQTRRLNALCRGRRKRESAQSDSQIRKEPFQTTPFICEVPSAPKLNTFAYFLSAIKCQYINRFARFTLIKEKRNKRFTGTNLGTIKSFCIFVMHC